MLAPGVVGVHQNHINIGNFEESAIAFWFDKVAEETADIIADHPFVNRAQFDMALESINADGGGVHFRWFFAWFLAWVFNWTL